VGTEDSLYGGEDWVSSFFDGGCDLWGGGWGWGLALFRGSRFVCGWTGSVFAGRLGNGFEGGIEGVRMGGSRVSLRA